MTTNMLDIQLTFGEGNQAVNSAFFLFQVQEGQMALLGALHRAVQ